MPIRKVPGGYRYGDSGKIYPTREGAEKQAAAIHASGWTEKSGLDYSSGESQTDPDEFLEGAIEKKLPMDNWLETHTMDTKDLTNEGPSTPLFTRKANDNTKPNSEKKKAVYDPMEYPDYQPSVSEQRLQFGDALSPRYESKIHQQLQEEQSMDDPREKLDSLVEKARKIFKAKSQEVVAKLDLLIMKAQVEGAGSGVNTVDDYALVKDGVSKPMLALLQKSGRPDARWWKSCISKSHSFSDSPADFCGSLWSGKGLYKGIDDDGNIPEARGDSLFSDPDKVIEEITEDDPQAPLDKSYWNRMEKAFNRPGKKLTQSERNALALIKQVFGEDPSGPNAMPQDPNQPPPIPEQAPDLAEAPPPAPDQAAPSPPPLDVPPPPVGGQGAPPMDPAAAGGAPGQTPPPPAEEENPNVDTMAFDSFDEDGLQKEKMLIDKMKSSLGM